MATPRVRVRNVLACLGVVIMGACSVPDFSFVDDPGPDASSGGTAGSAGTDSGTEDQSTDPIPDTPTGECTTNADCTSVTGKPVCDTGASACVECLPTDDPCPAGMYCTTAKKCEFGCNDDNDCVGGPVDLDASTDSEAGSGGSAGADSGAAGSAGATGAAGSGGAAGAAGAAGSDGGSSTGLTCNTTTHQCEGCTVDAECPPGFLCDAPNAKCIPGCTPQKSCPTSLACCSGSCENLQTSQANCGACGTPCAPPGGTGTCTAGTCSLTGCNPGYSDCNSNPADGCEAEIAKDPLNCGGCGKLCTAPANANPACTGGSCGMGSCKPGYADCNSSPTDGCEANLLNNVSNCGSCGLVCDLLNANEVCQAGLCAVGTCTSGSADCDTTAGNGCEVNTQTDIMNCGACGTKCSFPNATPTCETGVCKASGCVAPNADCNGSAADGCESNLNTDVQNCGKCATACNLPNATPDCSNGACVVKTCNAGFADCDGNAANGCEVNTTTSALHCGGCGQACSTINGTPSCTNSQCAIQCSTGFANCDANVANGCEINTTTNVNNCGSCGNVCSTTGGTPNCNNGTCGIANCAPGAGDCNGLVADGCETNLTTSTTNCGSCGVACVVTNGTGACTSSQCTIGSCAPGYADCNGQYADGCETSLSTITNCGACGQPCNLPNANETCAGGTCAVASCQTPFANCDGQNANGCEVNTSTSTSNCGQCNNACSSNHGSAFCSSGACGINCAAGWGNCNANAADGCETPITNDVSNCGGCGTVCSVSNGTPNCSGTTCGVASCNTGFANCDTQYANGCEVNTNSNPAHCGGCGQACNATNGTPLCMSGSCGINCNPGYGNCDGSAANGCEADLNTNAQNCGTCGTICAYPNAAGTCVSGGCQLGACTAGWANCDGIDSNGCEVNLKTLANCGACGQVCDLANASESCSSGTCSLVSCSAGYQNCDGNGTNGCEVNTQTSTSNCGTCGNACSTVNGVPTCTLGACSVACNSGWGNCDGNAGNGCEVNLTTTANCGTCGTVCSNANGSTACVAGACSPTCSAGYASCDGQVNNGCEANLLTSPSTCGSCGVQCTNAHGTVACANGVCTPGCVAGWGNCDANPVNGCETATTTTTNCGACGVACSNANGSTACTSGACTPTCNAGFGNCDSNPNNGCETNRLTDVNNCGTCGNVCNCPSGAANCVNGVCGCSSCSAGFGDCDGLPGNGCETQLNTLANCGGCGQVCDRANASETCPGGVCTLGACTAGFGNCDGNATNGCEKSLTSDVNNCGACGTICNATNGTPSCALSACSIACNGGWGNCDSNVGNGCETSLTTTTNCGSCGNACTNAHGGVACTAGACAPTCASGWGSCDGNANNGCETSLTTLTNCGTCGQGCNLANAAESCGTGTCTLGACDPGYSNCNGLPGDGCEASLASLANCGACGNACTNPNGSTSCTAGACVPVCNSGYASCDGNPSNGCEANTQTSITNCGGCGTVCNSTNGTPSCALGACSIACNSGFGNCNGLLNDGCETSLNTISNCGACGNTCSNPNGSTTCTAGACVPTCAVGWANCDGNPNNGCETNIQTSGTNCGACGTTCQAVNGSNSCSSGVCTPTCNPGFQSCDANPNNGCETNTTNNINNCGACGTACTNAHGSTSCSGGACAPVCTAGWASCDSNPNNGCEVSTQTSTTNCGGCGVVCSGSNGSPSCSLGACSISCNAGYANCDGNAQSNGCEVNLQTSTSNCGACGNACTNANGTTTCTAGACVPTCAAGFGNCDGNPNNGCETNLLTSGTNCGACGTVCQSQNGTNSCTSGACTPSCNPGYASCDSNPNNGCEANLTNNVNNCGACGVQCTNAHGTTACVGSACSPSCSAGYGNCDGNNVNGCETNTNTSTLHCGACNNACGANQVCVNGSCQTASCGTGTIDCGGASGDCECQTDPNNPSCCGTSCNTKHSNGIGQFYYDCVALNTYNQAQALKACEAFEGPGTCGSGTCGGEPVVCSTGASDCTCWGYTGAIAGHWQNLSGKQCWCPTATSGTWN